MIEGDTLVPLFGLYPLNSELHELTLQFRREFSIVYEKIFHNFA